MKQYPSEASYLHSVKVTVHLTTHKPIKWNQSAQNGIRHQFSELIIPFFNVTSPTKVVKHNLNTRAAFAQLAGLLSDTKRWWLCSWISFWCLSCWCSWSGEVGSQSRSSWSHFLVTTSTAEGTKPKKTELNVMKVKGQIELLHGQFQVYTEGKTHWEWVNACIL